jgi:ABC-type nitrate/sulfonate/bicarbonate transport system substrate-binding protein
LISPFEVLAEAQGFNRLANAVDQLGHYQGVVGAARRSWAKQHERELVAYIRGYLSGLDWLFEPTNKNEAILLLRSKLPNMSEHLASKSYDILLDPKSGFSRKAELNLEGVRTVLSLRSEYGNPRKNLNDPSKYLELKYYETARAP